MPPIICALQLLAIELGAVTRNAGGAEAGLSNAKQRAGFPPDPPLSSERGVEAFEAGLGPELAGVVVIPATTAFASAA